MWIFGRFLQCSAAGISQKRWGFVPSLGSSKLVNGGLKVERDLAAMTWSMWLPRVAVYCLLFSVHRERCLQLIYFLLVPLPEWFASTMAESAGPLRRMVSGQHQKVLSRRWVAPFSRISKKRSEMGEGRSAVPSFFVPRFFGNSLPCITCYIWHEDIPIAALKDEDLDRLVQAVVSPRAPASPIRGVGGQLPPLGASGQCGGFQK